ncbi:threonine/homoserine/homoserine lactone efflux protein [Paraburkholderia caballeronis]|uniref:LysE family translocator n=1 Tax=Paraburkholderia caballeronis TaxID=416943 RepID=UPI001066E0A4|nr:LysE family transporter [Paraburkholderia caballeronis]TDV39025.1 threonine/homoserine/homoserine lactone efflux protein [Paraburkholderia caballeronis]
MFSISTAALMASGCATVLLMPGPTNTLLAAAGLRQGFRRSAHLTAAELAGYFVSITLWGICFTHASQSLSWLPKVLRIASGLYLAWLAIRLWLTASSIETSTAAVIGPRTLFSATVFNPKAILFAGSIFPPDAFAKFAAWIEAMVIFTVLLIPIGCLWIAIGAAPRGGRLPLLRPALIQRCASVVVALFSGSLFWTLAR